MPRINLRPWRDEQRKERKLKFMVALGVADVISSRVGISAEKGDPLGQMKLSSRAKAQAVQRDATALLTACGLALRSFD